MNMSPPTHHRSVRQGRRPSVSPTTARRRPSARRRPGAGFLPTWRPAARVASVRRTKEFFRVYAEDEFFAEGAPTVAAEARRGVDSASARSESCDQDVSSAPARGGVLAGLALLGAAGALVTVLTMDLLASAGQGGRRAASRSARADAGRVSGMHPVARALVTSRPRPRATRTSAAAPIARPVATKRHQRRAAARVAELARPQQAQARRAPSSAPAVARGEGRPSDSPAPSTDEGGPRSSATASVVPRASDSHVEFGFER
jgi:hypothetical protein